MLWKKLTLFSSSPFVTAAILLLFLFLFPPLFNDFFFSGHRRRLRHSNNNNNNDDVEDNGSLVSTAVRIPVSYHDSSIWLLGSRKQQQPQTVFKLPIHACLSAQFLTTHGGFFGGCADVERVAFPVFRTKDFSLPVVKWNWTHNIMVPR